MEAEKICQTCGERLAAFEFRKGACSCRACEMISRMRWVRDMAGIDDMRIASGRRPWGMRIKTIAEATA